MKAKLVQVSTIHAARWVAGALLALLASGCSLGVTHLEEVHYMAVPSGDNVNYYRVRLEAWTTLSKTKFASGWFPAEAVDSLYGSADEAAVAEAYKTRNQLREKYNEAILSTTDGYLKAAVDPSSKDEVIGSWLRAQRRVRATVGADLALPQGAVEIEYNPASGIALRHAGEKLVFALSSNPDDVLGSIANFSKDAEIGATVLKLSEVVRQRAANDVAALVARNEARGKVNASIVKRIDASLEAVDKSDTALELQTEVDSLRILLESLR